MNTRPFTLLRYFALSVTLIFNAGNSLCQTAAPSSASQSAEKLSEKAFGLLEDLNKPMTPKESIAKQSQMERAAAEIIEWRLKNAPRGYESNQKFQELNAEFWTRTLQTPLAAGEVKIDPQVRQKMAGNFKKNFQEYQRILPDLKDLPALEKMSEEEIVASLGFAVAKAQQSDPMVWDRMEKLTLGFIFCLAKEKPKTEVLKMELDSLTKQPKAGPQQLFEDGKTPRPEVNIPK